jgi:hypothetical protein
VYERGLDLFNGVIVGGFAHAYIVFTDSANPNLPVFFEGQENSNKNLIAVGAIGSGPPNGHLSSDKPANDTPEGSTSSAAVCNWLSILQNDVKTVNSAPAIPYSIWGPNSNSVLAYFLSTLPNTKWYQNPSLVGFGDCLPGVNCKK